VKIYCITSQPSLLQAHIKRLQDFGEFVVINGSQLTDEEVIEKAGDADILIAGSSGIKKLSQNIINGLPNLKFTALLTVGSAWVDVAYAKEKGILVSNIKGANSESVAEHTWGMILDLSKRITEFDRDVRNKGAYVFGLYKGREVYGKTIGIVGLGDIGRKVARIASAFNMKVLGSNKSGKLVDGINVVPLNQLIQESDIITLCLPLTEETRNLISTEEISKMKEGVILVNCSMEDIVDKSAVIKGLESKKLFGYGIETDIMKPVPADDPYLKFPNVVVTPHNAFNTLEADIKSYDLMVENIEDFVAGKPKNLV